MPTTTSPLASSFSQSILSLQLMGGVASSKDKFWSRINHHEVLKIVRIGRKIANRVSISPYPLSNKLPDRIPCSDLNIAISNDENQSAITSPITSYNQNRGLETIGLIDELNSPCRPVDGKGPGTWRRFSLRELHSATNNFNYDNKLGEGAIGSVYWGQLASGDQIAVKRLKVWSTKAEMEFAVEIEILGRVRHRNLLSLLGYCAEGEERLIVYDYMPNLSLFAHLHGHLAADSTLDWDQRMKIAVGSAEGLAYLHHYATPHIIHRDIKASNILLDDKFNPLVADFGLTKIIPEGSTHKGISGYSAPKLVSGKVSESCDVFSFGILIIELISGKKPIDRVSGEKQAIMKWARPLLLQGRFHDLVDAKLEGNFHKDELSRLVQVAALCTEIIPEERPSMQDVTEMLKEVTKDTVKLPLQRAREDLRPDEPVLCGTHPVGTDINTIFVSAKPV